MMHIEKIYLRTVEDGDRREEPNLEARNFFDMLDAAK